jgi:DNA adenine methylase
MTATFRPVLRYPGGKARLAPWIIEHLPPHQVYVEPFFGGGSVLLAKPPVKVEVANDLDGRVVNFFRVLRDRPDELIRAVALTPVSRAEYRQSDELTGDELEDARRFTVRVWQSFGVKLGSGSGWDRGGRLKTKRRSLPSVWSGIPERLQEVVERLQHVQIECRPAEELIAAWQDPGTLFYIDPPYPQTTRGADRLYRHEMNDDGHTALLDQLDAHPGMVVISGYRCPLYDERLVHWRRIDCAALALLGARRTESIWLNRAAAAGITQQRFDFEVQP